ncbi:disease resistance protein RPV1-like [Syzygium oleosum]|uniref:disease resistance protein RPV1-like n=1 Tax=Syzygium oleosum TaxID=219896 RepID=UPI0024BAC63E|nr:disease resistance protein RPV1-like [Syzygium oleosum]
MDMGKSTEAGKSGGESSTAIDYDVFLSFRGPDTRQGFTDCLYNDMLEANIHVFFDEEELRVGKEIGDELPTAIEKSKIYVPIFSKGYASSPWCLNELAHMLECKKSNPSEKEIMPVFYDVEPCDVKLKSQLYINALEEHEEKFGPRTRQKWEDALKSVAQIKGWELKKQRHWKFIKSVTREILMKLKIKDKYVTEHLVGMDDRVEAVVKLLDVDSGGMRFVLIHGMGGIGKTTLAKIVYNKLNSLFSHCCFLGNVRESSRRFGLVTLQKQLLSNMFGSGFHDGINDIDDGIKLIAQRLSNRKVFIIVDDVDEEQLEKLAIKHVSFGSGSRVIMTTRNRIIIEASRTFEYEVKPLDSIQSLELFYGHAFGKNPPPNDYVSLSRQVVSTTGGLPLALEVIGSLLRCQNKGFWIGVLHNLREITHEKVQNTLKICYNALKHEQKQIFLDIACLFVDEDKTNAFYMWKDCGFEPDYSTQVLVCMSLIKITDDNKFCMHEQLRDLGRKIICEDTRLVDPRKQSRLWDPETAVKIIRTEERKEAIEAVCLDENAPGIYTSEEFSRLPNIRFLKLRRGRFVGDFKNQLSELRYLSWNRCPHELLVLNFHPSNLVVLNLSNSFITEDWAGWSQIKVAKKLKVLDLTNCNNMTRTPIFSNHLSLERLIVKNCRRLIEVDGSLEKLNSLIYFNVDGCTSLTELCEGIGRLEKLEYLYLGNCRKLRKLPESFARVASLVELDLSYTAITRLPVSIGNQKRLSVLKLHSTQIDELPSSIGDLRELKSLSLSRTKIKKLPISIGNLESLLELDISGTRCLRLPESIGDLRRLKVLKISNSCISELPRSIVTLKELEELHGRDCPSLKWEVPEGISGFLLFRVLDLQATCIRNVPATIQLLPCLEKLNLWRCSKLEVLPKLPISLISLSFGSSSLQWVPDLSNLTKLVDLSYGGHDENYHPLFFQDGTCQQSLMFLPPSLSILSLEYHESITSLSFHCDLRNLTRLRIYQCCWKEVQLDGLEQLIEFEVEGSKLLERFAGLSRLKRLKLWKLIDCPNLTVIQGLCSMESLEQLEIKECPKIKSLDDLSDLKKLEYLVIRGCEELPAVKGLDELETLKRLDFNRCRSLESFANVFSSRIPDRCCITIFNCSNLVDPSYGGLVSSYKQWKVLEMSNRVRNQSSQRTQTPRRTLIADDAEREDRRGEAKKTKQGKFLVSETLRQRGHCSCLPRFPLSLLFPSSSSTISHGGKI